ncbi:MAG: hypothetical protein N3B18_04365 [Desulfobacterota bacterium]|nr:hypothetical protein [Thermodesulfobacteriota bacterium]
MQQEIFGEVDKRFFALGEIVKADDEKAIADDVGGGAVSVKGRIVHIGEAGAEQELVRSHVLFSVKDRLPGNKDIHKNKQG